MTFSFNFQSFLCAISWYFVPFCLKEFIYYSTLFHVEWIPFLNQCHRNNIEKSCFYFIYSNDNWIALAIVCVSVCVRKRKIVNFPLPLSVSCNVYFSVVIIVSINLYWQPLVNFLLALSSVLKDKREKGSLISKITSERGKRRRIKWNTRRISLTHWNWCRKKNWTL